MFYREKNEKLRHWERRSGDPSIYIEYVNGCGYLDHLISMEIEKIKERAAKKQGRKR
jgi:hypothetical protein